MGNQRDSRPDKVEPLYITEEMACDDVMDERLQKQIKKEADEIENCLMKSEELKDVKTPDGMLDEIIGKLKNKGIWDEQEEIPESMGGETEPAGKIEEWKKERGNCVYYRLWGQLSQQIVLWWIETDNLS